MTCTRLIQNYLKCFKTHCESLAHFFSTDCILSNLEIHTQNVWVSSTIKGTITDILQLCYSIKTGRREKIFQSHKSWVPNLHYWLLEVWRNYQSLSFAHLYVPILPTGEPKPLPTLSYSPGEIFYPQWKQESPNSTRLTQEVVTQWEKSGLGQVVFPGYDMIHQKTYHT